MQRAAALAHRLDAHLTLLHVAANGGDDRSSRERALLARHAAEITLPAGRPPDVELRSGDYVPTIANLARELDADLVVLGSQQRQAMAPLVGTTAERIIGLSARPTLIVNLEASVRYRAVVIAAELSEAFVRVVRAAGTLRLLEGASVSVVHGFESRYRSASFAEGFDGRASRHYLDEWERAATQALLKKLDDAGVESSRFRLVFQHTRPLRAIQRVVRSIQPELIVVGAKDRSMLNRIMRGSSSNDLLRTIEYDILVAAPGSEIARVLH